MKTIFIKLTAIIIFISFHSFSQNGDLQYATPRSQYVGQPVDEMRRLGEAADASYENNKKYRDNLIDWIYDLKKKTNEQQLLDALNSYFVKLYAIDRLESARGQLDEINSGIKREIASYNNRVKEAPKKFWESGNENLRNKNYSAAISDYTEIIKLNPEYDGAYANRGIAYEAMNNHQLAINDFNKLIELKPNDVWGYHHRGWIKYNLNDKIGALADFNKEIEIEPYTADGYYDRGSAKSELGDENSAISDYSRAIELKSDFSMAYNNRGWAKYKLKKYTEALSDLNKAIQLDNKNWVAYDSRQETKFALNNFKGCVQDCDTAISLNPKCANSYLIRGRAYYRQANKIKACEDWSKAGELGKAEAYDFISKYCNNGGR